MDISGFNMHALQEAHSTGPALDDDLFRIEALSWTRLDEGQADALRLHFQEGLPMPSSSPREPTLYARDSAAAYFRFTDSFPLEPGLNTVGWSELSVSSSGSIGSLAEIIEAYGADAGNVTVLDLQQESHAIVDGHPVSWDATGEWTNIGLSAEQVAADEIRRIAKLHADGAVTLTPRPNHAARDLQARQVLAPSIYREADIVEASGARYERIPTANWLAPRTSQVDAFIALEQSLPGMPRLHIHCREGRGRTGTFLAMHDMLRNAQRVPLVELIERQRAFHPHHVFCKPSEIGNKHYASYTRERFQFFRLFYEYASANPMGKPQTWSAWLAKPAAV